MKKNTFILSLLFLSSCGLFEENHREVTYNLANGSQIKLSINEVNYPLSEKTLTATAVGYDLEGKDCEDIGLKNVSVELWSEIVKRNNLSAINSGVIVFIKPAGEVAPYTCRYFYSKNKNGEWAAKDVRRKF